MANDGGTALSFAISRRNNECAIFLLDEAGASWRRTVGYAEGRVTLLIFAFRAQYECAGFLKAVVRRMRAEELGDWGISACMREARGERWPMEAVHNCGHWWGRVWM